MPTTVTDNTGVARPLWQLPDLSAPEPTDGITYSMLRNEMCEGYKSQSLVGLNTGVKSWKLQCPTLAGSSVIAAAITDPFGATVSRADYVRNTHKWNATTGLPFVYQDANSNNQYYLVDFVEEKVPFRKTAKGIDIYEASFTLRQRRINGITVFDMTRAEAATDGRSNLRSWLVGSGFSSPTWTASSGFNGTASGDVVKISAAQNGQDIVRFDASAVTGFVSLIAGTLSEVFLVMKMRENTFSTNANVFSGSASILIGASGTTKFQNKSYNSDFEYRLNGTAYAQSNQQAPMNAWGIVHIRYPTTTWTMGGTAYFAALTTKLARCNVDIGEAVMCVGATPRHIGREITEALANKWAVTI